MKLFIITVACFGAFSAVPNNAHETPAEMFENMYKDFIIYKHDATDPIDDWYKALHHQVLEASLLENVTQVENIVKSVCSSGVISQFNSTQFHEFASSVVYAGSAEMLQLLFDNGLKFNEMSDSLLNEAICPDLGKSRLHRAELVKTLFENGATLSLENDGGTKLLQCAFAYGEMDVMEMLITNGVDVNARDSYNDTLLHKICEFKLGFEHFKSRYLTSNDIDYNMRKGPFRLLLDKGADINAINDNGYTPMHLVAKSRHLEAAEMLLDAGADVNIQSKYGFTPLFLAFVKFAWDLSDASSDIIKLLVQNGARLKDNKFYNALRIDPMSPLKSTNTFCENILN